MWFLKGFVLSPFFFFFFKHMEAITPQPRVQLGRMGTFHTIVLSLLCGLLAEDMNCLTHARVHTHTPSPFLSLSHTLCKVVGFWSFERVFIEPPWIIVWKESFIDFHRRSFAFLTVPCYKGWFGNVFPCKAITTKYINNDI